LKLSEIISLDLMQKIQDLFAEATGLAAVTVDFQGVPILEYSSFSQFCTKLREDNFYNYFCRQSDAHSGLEAVRSGSLFIHKCHAGLIDFSVPIIVDGEYVANFMCGQVIADDGERLENRLLEHSDNLFTDRPELRDLYDKIPVMPVCRVRATANLLQTIVDFIVRQFLLERRNTVLLEGQSLQTELKRKCEELEIRLLHSQIPAHFLFNALNTAGRQAHLEGAQKTEDVIYTLADMFRHYMQSPEPMIPIERELQNVRNYLFIQKARFGDQISFDIDVTPEVSACVTPAMSLQVLVENSMLHGLEKKNDLGYVKVRGSRQENRIRIEVEDNGVGTEKDRISLMNDMDRLEKSLPKFHGSGIYNLYKRMKYFWGDDFQLRFLENPGGGMLVRVEMPARLSLEPAAPRW
jgi:ligand-binding sensor protein